MAERSVYNSRMFYQFGKKNGWISDLEWGVYDSMFQNLQRNYLPLIPYAFIFLDEPAKVCLEQTKHQGHPEENEIDLTYLKEIETIYGLRENPEEVSVQVEIHAKTRDTYLNVRCVL